MKNLRRALQLAYQSDARAFRLRIVYVLLQSLLPLANLYVLKLLIDTVEKALSGEVPGGAFVPVLAVMCGIYLLNRVVGALSGVNNDVLGQHLVDHISDLLQRQAARLDLAQFDTPAYHDTYHRAQQESAYRPLQILSDVMSLLGSAVTLVGVAVILCAASWWVLALLAVAAVPSFAVRLHKARSIYAFRRETTPAYRRSSYFSAVLTAPQFASEVRAFRLAPHFRKLFVDNRRQLVARLFGISRRLGRMDVLCAVVEAAAMLVAVGLLAGRTVAGGITVGTFVVAFEAFRRGQTNLQSFTAAVSGLYDSRLFIGNLFEYLALEPAILSPADPVPFPQHPTTVEFCDITFRYPDMQRPLLEHYNLTVRRGEVASVEGPNGSGKSTLVRLLLRLYDPQEGVVKIDGIDIRRFALDDLRRSVGVLFQDFARYNATLRENIVYGDIQRPQASVDTAAGLAAVDNVAATLPEGYDTPLGRLFERGQQPSMGQWQRIAFARALQSEAPILVLDEPAAWMDTAARAQLETAVNTLAPKKIILFIRHR